MTTTYTPTDRQHISVSLHLDRAYGLFQPALSAATPDQHIASVEIVAGLRVQTEDPSIFRELAQMLQNAAATIDTACAETEQAAAAVAS